MKNVGFACTTIFPDAPAVKHNISHWLDAGFGPMSFAMDRKSGELDATHPDVDIVSFGSEPRSTYERLCPWDSYSRKNLSFARLSNMSIDYIFETDDDNFLYPEKLRQLESSIAPLFSSLGELAKSDQSNVFQSIYDVPNNIWARGYPLQWLEEPDQPANGSESCETAGVIQFLVDGNPDVDAIYRLVFGNDIDLSSDGLESPTYIFKRFHPFNSQATMWPRCYFPLMYLPSSCEFRMTDIYRGYIAQYILYHHSSAVVYSPALVRQERNEHRIYRDFFGEHTGYVEVLTLLETLNNLDLAADSSPAESIRTAYARLTEVGIFDKTELILLDAYLESLA
ncbi:DUF288 domain-containing protein [Halioglobus maricola]|uniref:DUF288 domain-containing protein n=1 Tax=Halioglobus maricola TaxID=2601894 RepID=A0A5P9NGZ1_9GAMM|nr:STELLO glycosyltransferase family protein [Halioglobus maricola]QFU74474.1 DUF288 domain-containing protein [Halioglobus maricola]